MSLSIFFLAEELSFGCPQPQIRFSRVRKPEPTHAPDHTTHSAEDLAAEESTQGDDGTKNRKMRFTDESYLWDDEIKNLRVKKRDKRSITKIAIVLNDQKTNGDTGQGDLLIRQKRKSGKTTGALSRQSKTDSGNSKSATSNRKVQSKLFNFKL